MAEPGFQTPCSYHPTVLPDSGFNTRSGAHWSWCPLCFHGGIPSTGQVLVCVGRLPPTMLTSVCCVPGTVLGAGDTAGTQWTRLCARGVHTVSVLKHKVLYPENLLSTGSTGMVWHPKRQSLDKHLAHNCQVYTEMV